MRKPLLVPIAAIVLILASVGAAFTTVRDAFGATAVDGKLESSSYTNADAAHVTLTNLNPITVRSACFVAVVSAKASKAGAVRSVPVCSGEMKPRTTVELVAPYPVGAVEELCASEEKGAFGIRRVDWSKCAFTTEAAL